MSSDLRPVSDMSSLAEEMNRAFPAYRRLVLEVTADVEENGGLLEYGLITDVFRSRILDDAMKSRDESRIVACFNFIERLLESPDHSIVDAVAIRVTPYLLHDEYWKNMTMRYAGIKTLSDLDREVGGGDWRNH